jgi:hypothetical protein
MRRLIATIIVLILVISTTHAQDGQFRWEPHPFWVSLPEGWTAVEDAGRLLMATPEDIELVKAGEPSTGLAVVVQIAQPPPQIPGGSEVTTPLSFLGAGRRDALDLEVEDRLYLVETYPTVDIPANGSRQGRLVLIADTFMLTATAPVGLWDDVLPTLDYLIESVIAVPIEASRPPELTGQITWHGLNFRVPEDWMIENNGNDYGIIATTEADRRYRGATFSHNNLTVLIRDLSFARPILEPESLFELSVIGFGMWDDLTGFREEVYNEFIAYVADFPDPDNDPGTVMLLMSPYHAYLVVGTAGTNQWAASEQLLFENILQTMTEGNITSAPTTVDAVAEDSAQGTDAGLVPASGEWDAFIIASDKCESQKINWIINSDPGGTTLEVSEPDGEPLVLVKTEPDLYMFAFDAGPSITVRVLSPDHLEGELFDGVSTVCDVQVLRISGQRLFEDIPLAMALAQTSATKGNVASVTITLDDTELVPTSGEWDAVLWPSDECERHRVSWTLRAAPDGTTLEVSVPDGEGDPTVFVRTEPDLYLYLYDTGLSLNLRILSPDQLEGEISDDMITVCEFSVTLRSAFE